MSPRLALLPLVAVIIALNAAVGSSARSTKLLPTRLLTASNDCAKACPANKICKTINDKPTCCKSSCPPSPSCRANFQLVHDECGCGSCVPPPPSPPPTCTACKGCDSTQDCMCGRCVTRPTICPYIYPLCQPDSHVDCGTCVDACGCETPVVTVAPASIGR